MQLPANRPKFESFSRSCVAADEFRVTRAGGLRLTRMKLTRILCAALALTGCKLEMRTSSSPHPATSSEHARVEPGRREPAFDDRKYKACIERFDANYDAWLPVDREVKDVLAHVKGKSPYFAVPALLTAYERLDDKAVARQTGSVPAGAIYAPATRLELATALVSLAASTHVSSCVDNQFRVAVDDEYLPPLTATGSRCAVARAPRPARPGSMHATLPSTGSINRTSRCTTITPRAARGHRWRRSHRTRRKQRCRSPR